jgi:hypothetical protein
VVRAWIERDHPEVDRVAIHGFCGDDLTPLRIKIPVGHAVVG